MEVIAALFNILRLMPAGAFSTYFRCGVSFAGYFIERGFQGESHYTNQAPHERIQTV